jgi:hypothetical protein
VVPRAVNKNRGKWPLAEIVGHSRVSDCIQAKYVDKFVVVGPGEIPLNARNKQIDRCSIVLYVKASGLKLDFIGDFFTKEINVSPHRNNMKKPLNG